MGIQYDDIIVDHTLKFGRITPTNNWIRNAEPGISTTYSFNIDDFPLDDLPSGGNSNRISPGEMAVCYLRLDNYPKSTSDSVTYIWYKEISPGNYKSIFKYISDD